MTLLMTWIVEVRELWLICSINQSLVQRLPQRNCETMIRLHYAEPKACHSMVMRRRGIRVYVQPARHSMR